MKGMWEEFKAFALGGTTGATVGPTVGEAGGAPDGLVAVGDELPHAAANRAAAMMPAAKTSFECIGFTS